MISHKAKRYINAAKFVVTIYRSKLRFNDLCKEEIMYDESVLPGSLQIPQQNLTVSHQFNLCHKLARKYYKKSHVSRFTAHHMAIFQAISSLLLHNNNILSIPGMCPVSDALPPCISNRDICC